MALFAETWDGTAAGWPAQWVTATAGVGTVVDRVSGRGRLATGTSIYNSAGAENATGLVSNDYTLVVDMVVPILSEWYVYVSVRGAVGLVDANKKPSSYEIRFVGASGGASCQFWEIDALGGETFRGNGGAVLRGVGTPVVAGDTVRIKVEVSGTTTITLREKAWATIAIEPPYTTLSSLITTNNNGAYFSLAVQGGNNTVSEDFLFDDLSIDSLGTAATQTVTAPLVTSTQTLFGPTVTTGSITATLPLVTSAQTIFAPTVAANALLVLPLVTGAPTVFTPQVIRQGIIDLPLVTSAPTVFTPTVGFVNPTQTVTLLPVYATYNGLLLDENGVPIHDENGYGILLEPNEQAVFPPSAAIITGTQTPTLPLVSASPTVFSPATYQIAVLPLVTSAQTLFEATITQFDPHLLPLVENVPVVFAPSASQTGILVVSPELAINTAVVFAPSVALSSQAPVLPLVTNTIVVYSPAVSHFVVVTVFTFEPPHDEGGPRKLSEYGRRRAGVSRIANELAGHYGAPRSFSVLHIGGVYQTIQGPSVAQINTATEYYAGGHIHEVTATQAAALEAAGYEVAGYP